MSDFLGLYVLGLVERVQRLAAEPLPDLGSTDATYCRISDDREGRELGVERQLEDALVLAERSGARVPKVAQFVDNDISASNISKKPRPDFDRLLAYVVQGKVKRVFAYSNSRLTRRNMELEILIYMHQTYGLEIHTVASGSDDLSTAGGRAMARQKATWDALAAEEAQERILRQQLQHARMGNQHQGRHRTFGFNRDMTHNATEAPIVAEIFKRKANGESLQSLAVWLNDQGIPTTGGGRWDASVVSKMIKRRSYIGQVTIKGEVIGAGNWEPLTDEITWMRANELVKQRANRGKNTRKGFLSGFVRCGECLQRMQRGVSAETKNNGGYNYHCVSPRQNHKACGSNAITGASTDLAVFAAAWRKAVVTHEQPKHKPKKDYPALINAVRQDMTDAKTARDSGRLTMPQYIDILDDLNKRESTLLTEQAADVAVLDEFPELNVIEDFERLNLSQKKVWLEQFIEYVVIAKADPKLPKKGYKVNRLHVYYTDGTDEVLTSQVIDDLNCQWTEQDAPPGVSARWVWENNCPTIEVTWATVRACDECPRPYYARGKCKPHYKALYRSAGAVRPIK